MTSFLRKKKTRKKDVVKLNIVAFDLIGLLPTNHVIPYITMVYQRKRGNAQRNEETLNVNSKIAQTRQNVGNFTVRQLSLQEICVLCSNSFVFAPECWKCTLRWAPSTLAIRAFSGSFFLLHLLQSFCCLLKILLKTVKIWVVLLISWSKFPSQYDQSEALPTVSVKMVGTLWGLLVSSMLVYKIWWPNRDKQLWEGRGEHEKRKNSVWLKCPNYFCLRL